MKNSIILLAAAAALLSLASCNKQSMYDMPQQPDRNLITFNLYNSAFTKATETGVANISSAIFYARHGSANYIEDQSMSISNSGVCSNFGTYYYPASGSLDFYAWGPSADAEVSQTAYNVFSVTPASTPASQKDFVFAYAPNKTSGDVNLAFKHAESQLVMKVKNTNASLFYEIKGWKVVNINDSGVFTFTDFETNGKLKRSDWDFDAASLTSYECAGTVTKSGAIATAEQLSGNMIVVPQDLDAATDYENSALNGCYVAVRMAIKNAGDSSVIAAEQWCCWPVDCDFLPGYKYAFNVDLAEGGMKEGGDAGEGPVLGDSTNKITFATVTVEDWVDGSAVNGSML